MSHDMNRRRLPRARRGNVYLLVLATTTIIATLVSGTLYSQTLRIRSERASADASKARLAAESGIDIVRAWIKQDAAWRSNRTSGRWSTNLAMGDAKVDLDVVDTVDGNLGNHPYHSVLITATARVGDAEQIMTAALTAKPYPIDALAYAIHTAGQIHVRAGSNLILGSATASTNGALRNDNTIEGNVLAGSVTSAGTVFGTVQTSATSRAMPDSAKIDQLISLGTTVASNKIDTVTLSSTSNPYGSVNSYGIYVVRPTGDFELKDTTVNGTLIVICPAGKTCTVKGTVRCTPASDLPALVVRGDLNVDADTGRFDGIVHSTGKTTMTKATVINGLLIAESSATTDAVDLNDDRVINYNSALYTSPPVGYAKSVDMVLQQGSYQRVVR